MKVILTKDVPGLGRAGDVKDVTDGYGRNYIIGRKLGVAASQSQLDKINKELKEKADKSARQQSKLEDVHNRVHNQSVYIKKSASGVKLFAGVHEADIIQAIKSKFGLELLPKQVIIKQAIKTTGSHTINLKLTPKHQTALKVLVEAE